MSPRKLLISVSVFVLLTVSLMLSVALAVTGTITQNGEPILEVTQLPDPGEPNYGFITQCSVGYATIPLRFAPDEIDDNFAGADRDIIATVVENNGTVMSVDVRQYPVALGAVTHNMSFSLESAGVPNSTPSTVYVYDVTDPEADLEDDNLNTYAANVRASAGNTPAHTFVVDPNPYFDADCFPDDVPPGNGSQPPVASPLVLDDRLNREYGDNHLAILYPGADGVVDLYDYATDVYYTAFVTPEDIAPYRDDPPASPVLIDEFGWVRAYVLPSSEIQFMFGPGPEGKVYTLVMSDLNGTDSYGTRYDPNER